MTQNHPLLLDITMGGEGGCGRKTKQEGQLAEVIWGYRARKSGFVFRGISTKHAQLEGEREGDEHPCRCTAGVATAADKDSESR